MPRSLALALLLILPAFAPAAAQEREETTRSIRLRARAERLLPLESVAHVDLPRVDPEAARKEDLERERLRLPPRFAIPHDVRITPNDHGTWEDLDAETLIWRLRVRAQGALSLNLGFGSYRMPPGGELWIHAPNLEHVVRPFTAADNEAHGELWTPVVPADELVVEASVPKSEVDRLDLALTRIGYGYRGFGPAGGVLAFSQSCNVDVVCPEGDPWRLEIPSVGVISLGGFTFCSGFLVNNARMDLTPYFMTADHCGVRAGNAPSLVVYWNYQNSFCRPPGSAQSGQPGDGTLNQFDTGSVLRARYVPSDFTLVELDDEPDPAFDVSFAGWNRSGADATSAAGIHHPNTEEKRISFEFDTVRTTSYGGTSSPGDGTHVYVSDWDVGTTEGGSSGSPLFDQDHRVIGQLGGGVGTCASTTIMDWYGSFARSWTGGGTSGTRLSDWLDPDGIGVQFVDTVTRDTVCTDAGTIALERARYGCEDMATILVIDCGLNADECSVETATATVDSDTEPGGETVLLTETGLDTSRFQGSVPLSGTDGAGVLLVGAGDTVTACYLDADDGMGGVDLPVATTAVVDCAPPVILDVSIDPVGVTTVLLTISADEPIVAKVDYGLACDDLDRSAVGEELGTSATVTLVGLSPSTTYYLRAVACDEAGNTAADDGGGACHQLTTQEPVDFFTEEFLGDNDLAGLSLEFWPVGGIEGYTQCNRSSISSLPVDPAGGTVLALNDDDFERVNIAGGERVELFGWRYAFFFVGSNGYVTFGANDTGSVESPATHFARRRVAALFDDLDPGSGGTVSWRQLADRVAVTWEDVPEAGTSSENTFQIELFFDGRIRMSYLALAATDGLAGLSRGGGPDPEFFETDLSAAIDCFRGHHLRRGAGVDAPVSIER